MSDEMLSDDDLAAAKAADLVAYLGEHPEEADRVEAAEETRDDPRLTVLAALEKARAKVDEEPLVAPDTDDVSDLDETQEEPDAQQEAQEDAVEDADEDAAQDAVEAPEDAAQDAVTFVCDQWAGVSLHGKGIKFNEGRFVTSDPRKIAVLDAWEHARRET